MGVTQDQKTQAAVEPASPTRSDALDTEGNAPSKAVKSSGTGQSTLLQTALRGAYDEVEKASPLRPKLDGWLPRITKVVNPVAFMTSADESGNRAKGNYDIGVTNKNAAEGFYELAKGECRAISGEIKSILGDKTLTSLERIHLEQMSLFLEGYATIYETLQSTGKSSSAQKRQQMTDNVNAVIMDVRASRLALDPTLFGDGFAVIDSSLNDISIFVNSWSTVAASSDVTSASPVMWASFLKTVERYRMILNNYDKLEAAGGDATGTSKMSMRHGAKTPEQADQVAMENGGYMAMALRTYGFYASDAAKMVEQIKEISKKVQSGEYETEEQCIAAFRAGIGGGKASELFYKKIDKVAKAQWKAYLADLNNDLARKSTEMANSDIESGNTHVNDAVENIDSRNLNMRNREENLAFFGMNAKEVTDIGKDNSIPVIQPFVQEHIDEIDEWNNGMGAAYREYHENRSEYAELASQGKVAVRDNTDVYLPPPDLTKNYDYELIGRGKMTNQELGYIDLKQKNVDAAETAAWGFHEQAKANLDDAKAYSGSANAHLGDAVTHLFKAQNYLTEAKYAANFIASDHPALVAGLHETQKQINTVQTKIGITKEQIAQVRTYQSQLDARLANVVSSIDNYDPAKLKVPLPSATVNGQALESEHYQKLSLSLSGPLFGSALKWVGGVSGEYAQTISTEALEDVWHKARIEAYAGVEADLWLVKAGIKLIGFFEAQVKNATGLLDTIDKGSSELGRWAYAWWYELDGMGSRISNPMKAAKQQANQLYDELKGISDADVATWKAKLTKSKTSMNDIHRVLSTRLLTAVSRRASLPGEAGLEMADSMFDLAEIEAGLDAMREAPNDERGGAVDKEKTGFGQTAKSAMDDAQSRIADVDPGTNDPDVKFEAGVGIEGYAKLGTSTSKMSMSVSGRQVYSMSDGDGEDFNYDVTSKTIFKVGISVGEFSGEITYMPLKDGNSFALAMSIPFAGDNGLDGSTVLQAMAGDLKTIRSKSAKEWIQLAKEKIAAREKDFKMPKSESSARGKVEIGGKVTLNDDWSFRSGEASFGIAVEMGAGTSFAKVSYEQGNKVTFKF